MSRERKLLIAGAILADLVLLLVWILRDESGNATSVVPMETERSASNVESSAIEGPGSKTVPGANLRSAAPVVAHPGERKSLAAPKLAQVRGTAYGLDGRALIGFAIGLVARDGHGRVVEASANSRADYYLEDLHAGHWTLLVRAEGFYSLQSTLDLREDEPVHHLDLTLQRRDELRIRMITPDGGSLVERMEADGGRLEVTAFATPTVPGTRLTEAQVNELALMRERLWSPPVSHADAVKGFGTDIEGYLLLGEPLPAFISAVMGETVVQTKDVPADTLEVTFVLALSDLRSALGSAKLRIVDLETGMALIGASTSLDEFDGDADGQGAFRFADILPGVHRLHIHAPSHEEVLRRVHIDSGRTNDLGVWTLASEASIRGRFCDAEGNGVTTPWSLMPETDADPMSSDAVPTVYGKHRTDSFGSKDSGAFYAQGLGRREYWLRTNSEKVYAPPMLVDTTKGEVRDVVVRVSTGVSITLRFANDEGRYVNFAIMDPSGAPVREGGTVGSSAGVCLGQGSYLVRYQISDDAPTGRSFDVGSQAIEVLLAK